MWKTNNVFFNMASIIFIAASTIMLGHTALFFLPESRGLSDALALMFLFSSLIQNAVIVAVLFRGMVKLRSDTSAITSEIVVYTFGVFTNITFFACSYGLLELNVEAVSAVDYIYFSMVTWSTLGYGDIQPLGVTRLVAGFQGLLGNLYLASFVAIILDYLRTLANKVSEDQRRIEYERKYFLEEEDLPNPLPYSRDEFDQQLESLGKNPLGFDLHPAIIALFKELEKSLDKHELICETELQEKLNKLDPAYQKMALPSESLYWKERHGGDVYYNISLVGLMSINPNSEWLYDMDYCLKYIKQILQESIDSKRIIRVSTFSKKLGMNTRRVETLLYLTSQLRPEDNLLAISGSGSNEKNPSPDKISSAYHLKIKGRKVRDFYSAYDGLPRLLVQVNTYWTHRAYQRKR